jgi:hypothetical protein
MAQVARPTYNPSGGTFYNTFYVTASCATSGATIRTWINGGASVTGSGPFAVTPVAGGTASLNGLANKSGWTQSPQGSASYEFRVANINFSVIGNIYATPQSLTLSTATNSATIFYTLDGSTPTSSSTPYIGAINLPTGFIGTIKAVGIKGNYLDSPIRSESYEITGTVDNPTSSVNSGTFYNSFQTTLSCTTIGATIRYTLDGSTPTSSSSLYTTALNITQNTTLKFIALKTNWFNSDVITRTYAFGVNAPEFSLPGGTYQTSQDVTLTCATSGATMYYTTDGSTPSLSSILYTTAINLPLDYIVDIKAIAIKTGWTDSSVITNHYKITGAVNTPTADIASGTYYEIKTVTLSCSTLGSSIYFTTDGSTPSILSTLYTTPLQIQQNSIIKMIGVKTDWINSAFSTYTYNIDLQPFLLVDTPTFNPSFSMFQHFVMISITTTTPDALIYYTIDGSTPNTITSLLYTGPFQINTTTAVKALGVKTHCTDSYVASKEYTRINMPLLCWQFTGRQMNGKVFCVNGDGEHPKVFTVPADVDVETCCLVDEGIEVEKSKYTIEQN